MDVARNESSGMQVALLSPYVQREVLQQGNGVSHDKPIILPNKVRSLCLAVQDAYQLPGALQEAMLLVLASLGAG